VEQTALRSCFGLVVNNSNGSGGSSSSSKAGDKVGAGASHNTLTFDRQTYDKEAHLHCVVVAASGHVVAIWGKVQRDDLLHVPCHAVWGCTDNFIAVIEHEHAYTVLGSPSMPGNLPSTESSTLQTSR
jgi:hypothetical protein